MDLVISDLDSDAEAIGLTKDSTQAAIESRLRSARLFDSESRNYLYLSVLVTATGFGVALEFNKPVFDTYSGEQFGAATWSQYMAGSHGNNGSYILGGVRNLMDDFLVQFLRVNEQACNQR